MHSHRIERARRYSIHAALVAPVRAVLRSLDPELPFIEVRTLRQEVDTSLWQERLLAGLSTIFGCFAALLAGIGLYGALDFSVKAKTREIGVRAALGPVPCALCGCFSVKRCCRSRQERWWGSLLPGLCALDSCAAL